MATGNLKPVLYEIRHALQALVEQGKPTMLDVNSIPFSPNELTELETFLGKGEIDLELDVLGKTRIQECAYAGVWRIQHFNEQDKRVGYFIEVDYVPEILRSQSDDIVDGLNTMTAILEMEAEMMDD
jgi:hydrogenase-1 operon protein HyaF